MNPLNRLFFAIYPDQAAQRLLIDLQDQFKAEAWGKNIRWTSVENLHITLRYLGAATPENAKYLITKMETALTKLQSFNLHFTKIALFPPKRKAHVLGVYINPTPTLITLVDTIEKIVVDTGFKPEVRPYLPHLTLGRLNKSALNLSKVNFPPFSTQTRIDKIALLNSESTQGKHYYSTLALFNCK